MGIESSKERSRRNASINYAGWRSDALEDVPSILGGSVHSLCAKEQSILVTGGEDQIVVVYDWTKHIVCSRLGGPRKCITKVSCNDSGTGLVHAGSRDHLIYGWNYVLETHSQAVTGLASSKIHSHSLCSGGRDTVLCLWDLPTKRCVARMDMQRNLVTDMCWLDPEMAVLQASEDLTLKVWDLRTAAMVQQFAPKLNILTCCAVSRDGNYFLSGTNGCGGSSELTLWDRRTGKALMEYRGHSEGVQGCVFMETSTRNTAYQELVVSCSNDRTVRIWSRDDGACLHTHHVDGAGPVTAVVSPSKDSLACSTFYRGVSVWSLLLAEKEGKEQYSLGLRASY
ncbi:hypothetical protein EMCRGX_G020138 [Ephydatia muelleri]